MLKSRLKRRRLKILTLSSKKQLSPSHQHPLQSNPRRPNKKCLPKSLSLPLKWRFQSQKRPLSRRRLRCLQRNRKPRLRKLMSQKRKRSHPRKRHHRPSCHLQRSKRSQRSHPRKPQKMKFNLKKLMERKQLPRPKPRRSKKRKDWLKRGDLRKKNRRESRQRNKPNWKQRKSNNVLNNKRKHK